MKFTFGICTAGDSPYLHRLLESIHDQNIPFSDYQIIVVGGKRWDGGVTTWIPFDETQMPKGWITRKKNLIIENAEFENIVFLHDYFELAPHWYEAWQSFTTPFDVAINPVVIGVEGTFYRHSDWLLDPWVLWNLHPELHWKYWDIALPYTMRGLEKLQYVSGGYWVAKRDFMERFPLDEGLLWGDAEDIEWSRRVREATTFKMNDQAVTFCQKLDKWKPGELPKHYLEEILAKFNIIVRYDNG